MAAAAPAGGRLAGAGEAGRRLGVGGGRWASGCGGGQKVNARGKGQEWKGDGMGGMRFVVVVVGGETQLAGHCGCLGAAWQRRET